MDFGRPKLNRHTLFVDDGDNDDDDDRDLGPLPLVEKHTGPPGAGLVAIRTATAVPSTVQTPALVESSVAVPQVRLDIPITTGSLWNKYQYIHKRNLGGSVIAVLELPAKEEDYLIRKLSIAEDKILLFRKRRLSHKNLCKTHEIFEDGGQFYCVTEPVAINLLHVCRCPKPLSEEQLVAITKQVRASHVARSAANQIRCLPVCPT